MRFEIEPKIGLGDFILGMNVNQVLTLIKRKGYKYNHCQIISGKEKNTPTFLYLPSESISLRFNYYTQNLELIEKKIITFQSQEQIPSEINKNSEYYYKNKLFYTLNKEAHYHRINYENIAKIFGLSRVPKKLNQNKNIYLEYSGIGFYFTSFVIDMEKSNYLNASTENSSVNTDSLLTKILIFKEDSLYESLSEKTNIFNKRNLLIKYDTNKPKSIKIKNENRTIVIKIGDHIEDVLRELNHPNYIHYTKGQDENYNNQDNGNTFYNQISDKIYYLNYFQYGFDIMISNNKVNRIIIHTNQVDDSKFGIYDRCNFILKLRNDYLKTLIENKDKTKLEINNIEKVNKKEMIQSNNVNQKIENNSRKNSNNEKTENPKMKEKKIEKIEEDNSQKKEIKKVKGEKSELNKEEKNKAIKNEEKEEDKNKNKNRDENNKEVKGIKQDNIDKEENKKDKKENNIKEENKKEEKDNKDIKKEIKDEHQNKDKEQNDKDNKEKEEKEKKEKEEKEKEEKEEKEKEEKEVKEKKEKEKTEEKIEEKKDDKDKDKNKENNEVKKEDDDHKKEKELNQEKSNEDEKKEDKNNEEETNKNSNNNENNDNNKNINNNRNNRKRRKKHGNPPKRKQNIDSEGNEKDEEEKEESEEYEVEKNKKEKKDDYIAIYPWTDFKTELLEKIEYDKNLRHQKWDDGTSKIINCYFFKGLLFEIVDKTTIGTVIIY